MYQSRKSLLSCQSSFVVVVCHFSTRQTTVNLVHCASVGSSYPIGSVGTCLGTEAEIPKHGQRLSWFCWLQPMLHGCIKMDVKVSHEPLLSRLGNSSAALPPKPRTHREKAAMYLSPGSRNLPTIPHIFTGPYSWLHIICPITDSLYK